MAELLSPGAPGNSFDPATATPEQVALQRLYAKALLEQSIKPEATHWTGALAQGLMGIRGQQQLDQATALQQAGIRSATAQDPNLAMLSSRNLLGPQGGGDLKSSILQQESGNNPNIRPSVSGAVGPGQIMPETFRSFAKTGENISNPTDNVAVSGRILDSYMEKYGDPARAAVAYFSGPGNVAPPGSPTPWLHDRKDPSGKSVSSYVSDVVGRMRQPQMNMAQNYSVYQHNPWANPKEQDLARGMITPTPGADVYGRPTVTSPMGGQRGLPVGPGVQPGVLVPAGVSGEGGVTTQIPLMAPGGGAPPSLQSQLQPLATVGQNLQQQSAASKAASSEIGQSTTAAYQAIPIRQTLAQMKDTIQSHGDKMVWGPTSDWVTNLKRGLAQHAPGFMSPADIAGISSADDFEKLSAQLQSMVGRQLGPTDASLFQGMKSVPGSHNSKQGALALIDMLDQVAQQNAKFMVQNQYKIGQPGFNLLAEKNNFFEQNPIINPITKNPIRMDLTGKGQAGQTKVINGKVYTKVGNTWHEGM